MSKILFIFCLFIITFSFVGALEINEKSLNCSQIELYKEKIINYKIPDKMPYKDEIFNIYLEKKEFVSISIEKGTIVNFSCEMNENFTYNIMVDNYQTINDFTNNLSIELLNQKISDKNIEIKGKSVGKKLKWFFSKFALKWFS